MKERDLQASDGYRQIASKINEVMKVLYASIGDFKVNTDVDLSSFDASTLVDFYIFTSGYVAIQRIDGLLREATEEEIEDIVNGKFYLGELSKEQVLSLCESVGHKIQHTSEKINLSKIQDGQYSILYNGLTHPGTKPGKLSLETEPVQVYSNSDVTYPAVLQHIRNIFAHEAPRINGNYLQFNGEWQDLEMSSMWLRGLCETMSEVSRKKDPTFIRDKILSISHGEHKMLTNIDDVKYIIKSLSPDLNTKPGYEEYIEKRLRYNVNYARLSTEQKAAYLADLVFYNRTYGSTQRQYPNADVIYLIDKIVNTESQKRGKIFATNEQLKMQEIKELFEQKQKLEQKIADFKRRFPNPSKTMLPVFKDLVRQNDEIRAKARKYLANLEDMRKTGVEDMYIATGSLENLNIEMAFNLICLMAYNALTVSNFYDDMLSHTDFKSMNDEQKQFFDSFDLRGISEYSLSGHRKNIYGAEEKAYVLTGFRNALIHNRVRFYLPDRNRNPNLPTFRDVTIEFVADQQQIRLVGCVKDFAKLFTSPQFFAKRTNNLVSTVWRTDDTNKDPDEQKRKPTDNGEPGDD